MEIIQSIALDFAQNATQATIFAKQYDKDTRKIEITPLNNGSPYTIDTDVTARLQMTKSDGTTVINNAEISSGKITVVLTAQALTSAGTAVAEIGLYKGSTLLSSQTFYIDVQKGAYDEDAPESSDEYNALVEALGEAEQATATAEAASERAEAAVDSANTAIETARTVATGKMSLIPIDPTVEEIEAMPSGQIYGDTVNHKGIVKDGQEFYDTAAIDAKLEELDSKKVDKSLTIAGIDLEDDITAEELKAALDIEVSDGAKVFFEIFAPPYYINDENYCKVGDIWVDKDISTGQGYRVSVLMSKIYISDPGVYFCSWQPVVPASFNINVLPGGGNLPVHRYSETGGNTEYSYPPYRNGDILTVNGSDYECSVSDGSSYSSTYTYSFKRAVSEADITSKMSLIPIDPTVEEIEAMPSGQLYGDTTNHKGVIKEGQSFYDTDYIDGNLKKVFISKTGDLHLNPPRYGKESDYPIGSKWINTVSSVVYNLVNVVKRAGYSKDILVWAKTSPTVYLKSENEAPPSEFRYDPYDLDLYEVGDIWLQRKYVNTSTPTRYVLTGLYICAGIVNQSGSGSKASIQWTKIASETIDATKIYSKIEIDNIIGAISTLSFEVVQSKPVSDIKTNVIYLVPKSTSETNNVYDEWIYVNNAWELIGSTEIDLSNYYTKNEINDKLTYKANIYDPVDIVPNVSSDYDFGAEYTSPEIPTGSSRKKPSEGDYVYNTDHFDLWVCTGVSTNFGQNTYHFTLKLLARGGKDINNVYTKTETNTLLSTKETTSNKVTSLSAQSTDDQYPTAKCVYDMIGDIESLLAEV